MSSSNQTICLQTANKSLCKSCDVLLEASCTRSLYGSPCCIARFKSNQEVQSSLTIAAANTCDAAVAAAGRMAVVYSIFCPSESTQELCVNCRERRSPLLPLDALVADDRVAGRQSAGFL